MSETSETPTVRCSTATAPAPAAELKRHTPDPQGLPCRGMGCHRRGARLHRLRHLLCRNGAGTPWRSPPPQAPRGIMHHHPMMPGGPGGPGGRWGPPPAQQGAPIRWARVGSRRSRTQPDPVVGRSLSLAVVAVGESPQPVRCSRGDRRTPGGPLTQRPVARCSLERRATRPNNG